MTAVSIKSSIFVRTVKKIIFPVITITELLYSTFGDCLIPTPCPPDIPLSGGDSASRRAVRSRSGSRGESYSKIAGIFTICSINRITE